jgi:hypothetical protein
MRRNYRRHTPGTVKPWLPPRQSRRISHIALALIVIGGRTGGRNVLRRRRGINVNPLHLHVKRTDLSWAGTNPVAARLLAQYEKIGF